MSETTQTQLEKKDTGIIRFPVSRYLFDLRLTSTVVLANNCGSILHGSLGAALKAVADRDVVLEVSDRLPGISAYEYLFTTPLPPDAERMRKAASIPRPYILEPPFNVQRIYYAGDQMQVGLVLVGRAIVCLPVFVAAFEEWGRCSIGKGLGHFQVTAVREWQTLPESATTKRLASPSDTLNGGHRLGDQTVTLRFLTPTRFEVDHKVVRELKFSVLFSSLLRRLRNLQYFHHEPADCQEDRRLLHLAKTIGTEKEDLVWMDQDRLSHGRWMPQGGFVGDVTFRGDLAELVPFLKLGEFIHIGKGTSFGLGKYRVLAEDFSSSSAILAGGLA